MTWREHITVDPHVCHGKACFTGTRIPVSVVLDNLAAGLSAERVRESYPSLTLDHLSAALSYAASLARDRVVPLSPKVA
jgi:uncharacterized protein (DUF433 family)